MIGKHRAKAVLNMAAHVQDGVVQLKTRHMREGRWCVEVNAGDLVNGMIRSGALVRIRRGVYLRGENWETEVAEAKVVLGVEGK